MVVDLQDLDTNRLVDDGELVDSSRGGLDVLDVLLGSTYQE